jgi:hyperosmotically inducible periplasmic protein
MRKISWLLLISSLCLSLGCTSESSTSTTEGREALPPSTPPPASDADNTARNADTSVSSETAIAQGESKADIEMTAAIRKAVVDDKALSVNAHNVKIMTANAVVTLRGPVKSEEEKKSIEAKAKQVAGVARIDNLLEVEKNP